MSQFKTELPRDKIADFCRRYHITKLSLFGSVLRDDFAADSDVDFLVEFESDCRVGYLTLAGMEIELSGLIGRKADLRTPEEISPYFRQRVVSGAEVQYDDR